MLIIVGIILLLLYGVYYYWANRRIIPNIGAVVITGASSGIGETCAKYLDTCGFIVFAGVRQKQDYEKFETLFAGKKSKPVYLDVADIKSIEQAVKQVEESLRTLNMGLVGLINNAGMASIGPLDALPDSEIRYLMEVNLFGALNTTNAFLPLLRKGNKLPCSSPSLPQSLSTVIHIGSTMGALSVPFYGLYSMSKYALEAMADAQRLELGQSSGIRVCLARLGNIQTPIFEKNKVRLARNMENMKNLDIYQAHLDMLPQVADAVTNGAADPIIVAKAVEHALTCASPAARLLVGWEAWILPTVWSLIPSKVVDQIIILLFNIITRFTKPKKS